MGDYTAVHIRFLHQDKRAKTIWMKCTYVHQRWINTPNTSTTHQHRHTQHRHSNMDKVWKNYSQNTKTVNCKWVTSFFFLAPSRWFVLVQKFRHFSQHQSTPSYTSIQLSSANNYCLFITKAWTPLSAMHEGNNLLAWYFMGWMILSLNTGMMSAWLHKVCMK